MNLELAIPFLRAVRKALDEDRTNMVRCTVGDLGVNYEDDIRAALSFYEASKKEASIAEGTKP